MIGIHENFFIFAIYICNTVGYKSKWPRKSLIERKKEERDRQEVMGREREKAKCKRGECLSERERELKKIEGEKPVCNPESSWVCVDSI